MSSIVSDIITDAYRESNLIAISASPTSPQATEALRRLETLIFSTFGNEVGYDFEDWTVVSATDIRKPSGVALTAAEAAAWVLNPQGRLQCNLSADTTIKLDPYPTDGQRFKVIDVLGNFATNNLTLDGNGRSISGAATLVLSTDNVRKEFFYRADLGEWVEISDLELTDPMPFPPDFDDFFTTSLAMRLNPRYGREIPEEAMQRYLMQRNQLIIRYDQQQFLRERVLNNKNLYAPGE
jgi:hypothetical protein